MIGCLQTRVHKQPIIVLYFNFETALKFYKLGTWIQTFCKLRLSADDKSQGEFCNTFDLHLAPICLNDLCCVYL